jgi:hypothetical protein
MSQSRPYPSYEFRSFDRAMRDYWGNAIARPIRLGKVAREIERLTSRTDAGRRFLAALAISARLKPKTIIKRVILELYQEGLFQWVFRVQVTAEKKNRTLCLTVAKDPVLHSRVASREWELLKVLQQRNPERVVRVFERVAIPAPDERGELTAYFSQMLRGYTELGVDARHRFHLVGQEKTKTFTQKQSDGIRAEILESLASFYDPSDRSALLDVEVNSGDFMGQPVPYGFEVKLIAVRRLHRNLSAGGLLRNLLGPIGEHAEEPFYLAPSSPELVISKLVLGFTKALGDEDKAAAFILSGLRSLTRKKTPCTAPGLSWSALQKVLQKKS